MKKILIVSHALEIGGAERSLIGLLDAIDKKEYQVDLNCFTIESAMTMVAGTARSMGIAVKGEFPGNN